MSATSRGRDASAASSHVPFQFNAVRPDGEIEAGTIQASSTDDARRIISERGLFALGISPQAATAFRLTGSSPSTVLAPDDVALGLRLFANLLGAGLPMSRALAAFAELAPPGWKSGLTSVRAAVREGQGLSTALDRSPLRLPPVVLGVVRAGEAAGKLDESVARAADMMQEAVSSRSEIRAALAYPVVLSAASVASTALLIGVVLPQFAALLGDMGQALPRSTQLLLNLSAGTRMLAGPATILAVGLILLIRQELATANGARIWHALFLRTPVVGAIRFSAATGRACAALSALLGSGMPIAPAIAHAARAAADAELQRRLAAARERVVGGARFSDAVAAEHALTGTAIQLVRSGEESGRMTELLAHAASLENEWVSQRVRGIVRLIEPILILAFGGLVALIAAALLQAVYSIRPAP
jgi:general secretion pathway protein F